MTDQDKSVSLPTLPAVKTYVIKSTADSNVRMEEASGTDNAMFGDQIIPPPYDPQTLLLLHQNSNALRQNVDAYVTNIDGHGHTYTPIINLDADDTAEQVRAVIQLESQVASGSVEVSDPTDAEVEARTAQLRDAQRIEALRLNAFFESATAEGSFVDWRRALREDVEITGNAFSEVLRNARGEVSRFRHIQVQVVRLMPLDKEQTAYQVTRRTATLGYEKVTEYKRFRRYVQTVGNAVVYFKEYGDPRVVSSRTGKAYATVDAFHAAEWLDPEQPQPRQATEILHFRIPTSLSPYGIPRWIGNLVSVLGSRSSEEVNLAYFENKSVPPMAITVSGGRLSKDTVTQLESYIKNEIHGKQNFHNILVIQAESGDSGNVFENSGKARINIQPLTEAQTADALFQNYDERNMDKVGMAFRLPRMLRGDTRDFNRSCYSEDTETLTENGWKLWHQIEGGERIAAFTPTTGEVKFVVPADKLVYDVVDEEMVHFQAPSVDVLVTGDHKMVLRSEQTRGAKPWETHLAAEIPYERFAFPVAATEWRAAEELSTFTLPRTDSCKILRGHTHQELVPGDAFLEYLGYWISEGGVVSTDHPAADYLVYIDQKKPHVRAKMEVCLDRLGWKYSRQTKPCGTEHYLHSNKCLRAWLIENCGRESSTKQIPDEFMHLSKRQLSILFQALMDGDGTWARGHGSYYTISEKLADQVQELATLLGYRTRKYWSKGASCYRVRLAARSTVRLSAKAHVSRPKYTGKVYCFSVPGYGFFVTRRNGKVALQGNTAFAALEFAERQVFAPDRTSFDDRFNRDILPTLGVAHWRFTSNGPLQRDPETLAKIIHDLQDYMTPNTLLELSEPVFGRNFSRISEDWGDKPLKLTLAEMNILAKQATADAAGGGTGEAEEPGQETSEETGSTSERNVASDNVENKKEESKDSKGAAAPPKPDRAKQPRQPNGKFGTSRKK